MQTKREIRIVKSKYESRCIETGLPIRRGEECLFDPDGRKVYHSKSDMFKNWVKEFKKDATFENKKL